MSEVLGNIKDSFCIALMMLLYNIRQSLSFIANREISNFQKSPSKPGKTHCNFIFLFIDTSVNTADGCIEKCRRNDNGWDGWSTPRRPRPRQQVPAGPQVWKMGTGLCWGQEFIVSITSKCNSKWDSHLLLTNSPSKRQYEEDST